MAVHGPSTAAVVLLVAGAALAGPATAAAAPARALTTADTLDVAATADGTKILRTADGRQVFLRGANVTALVDYGGAHGTVPVTADDGAQARALGFTVVRLAVSWSRIEPQRGTFDTAYLDDIRRSARVFADQGIYVLLDMHQDRYAAGLGPSGDESDGAPGWAAKTDLSLPVPPLIDKHPYYGTSAARTAARNFFENDAVGGRGLQDHYADAVAQLAAVGDDLGPALAGIELYNEPIDPFGTVLAPDTFSAPRLWPFYDRLIERLRGADGRGPGAGAYAGPIWFEPQATRTQNDADLAATAFTPAAFSDPDLVYGPHVYTDVFGRDPDAGTPAKLAASFDAAAREARTYGAALAPTELPGAANGPILDGTTTGVFETHRANVLGALDRLGVGGMVWTWKQHPSNDYGWGVLNADGSPRTDSPIARDYGRARVQASAPRVLEQTWSGNVLTVRTDGAGPLDLWDGAAFAPQAPDAGVSGALTVDGAAPAGDVRAVAASAKLGPSATWAGGRELRVVLPAGTHTVVLRPTSGPGSDPGTGSGGTGGAGGGGTGTTADGTGGAGGSGTGASGGTAGAGPSAADLAAILGRLLGGVSTAAGTSPARPVARRAAPKVSRVRADARRFRVPSGRAAGGTRVVATVSGASRVLTRLVRETPRRKTITSSVVRVAKGRAVVRIPGRAGGRALAAGRYRLRVVPIAGDGTQGPARSVVLRVLGPSAP